MRGLRRAHTRDLSLEGLFLLNPLLSLCLELYANCSQLSQPFLLLFRATSRFGLGLAVRFCLNAKTSVGLLEALAPGFFVLAQGFDLTFELPFLFGLAAGGTFRLLVS